MTLAQRQYLEERCLITQHIGELWLLYVADKERTKEWTMSMEHLNGHTIETRMRAFVVLSSYQLAATSWFVSSSPRNVVYYRSPFYNCILFIPFTTLAHVLC